jgi:hypothetical protein
MGGGGVKDVNVYNSVSERPIYSTLDVRKAD